MIGVTNFPDAPKDGKQYGRKDGHMDRDWSKYTILRPFDVLRSKWHIELV